MVLLHALMKLGAVACPLSPHLTERERADELERAQPALILTGSDGAGLTEADLPLLGEHDLDGMHCRILTSGTSGHPRPVGLTYGNHLWSAVGSAFNLGVEPTDRWLCCMPLNHIAGLSIVMRSVIYGTGPVIHDGFDIDRVAESLEGDGVTLVSLVATQLARLLEAGVDLLPLRAVLVGGGPVPVEVLEEALGRGATVVQTYGMTETASQVTTLAPMDARRKLGSGAGGRFSPRTCGSRTARSSSRARRSHPERLMRTAGSTPATWAASTRTGSSTSRTGWATSSSPAART